MPRLLIVSNRLPIRVTRSGDALHVRRDTSDLATGLALPRDRSGGLWVGWPGVDGDAAVRAALAPGLERLRMVPVWLDAEEARRFDQGFASGVLWPVFHYLLDQVPLRVPDWDAYARVNARYADVVLALHRPGDVVWVHDHHLMLVPQLLRARVPEASIGFFLHTPFPTSEVVRILTARDCLLEGVLGADLIGFHTAAYVRHFASSLLRILGIATDVDRALVGDRTVRLGVFPMGVDPDRFARLAADATVAAEVRALRQPPEPAVLVGVDRFDGTTGVPRRLAALETLLETAPELRERVRLLQVVVPPRAPRGAYRAFRRRVDEAVGRLNARFGTARWTPVECAWRRLADRDLVALYRAADVMLVTPVRDGPTLMAKEFVAARTDGDGVLVLSEFAGAATELAEAVLVNPYDVDETADALRRAVALAEGERRARMQALRKRVLGRDVHAWAQGFLDALADASVREERPALAATGRDLDRLSARMAGARSLLLLLDYDGTLVPFAPVPEMAMPDDELLGLLRALAARPGTHVHVVSGRTRGTMDRWLGALSIGLHAEHGFWSRPEGGGEWRSVPPPPSDWRARVLPILEHFAARTPGSLVEEKSASIAWHYRMAEPEYGATQANELRLHLTELLSNAPVEILIGDKVIEVRAHGVNKGTVVAPLLAALPEGTLAVAFGDDRTDEDLFAALPQGGVAVHVGRGPTRAALRVARVADARRLLARLAPEPRRAAGS
jgi:trehalose 6-phosphate synthase/phosphatase